ESEGRVVTALSAARMAMILRFVRRSESVKSALVKFQLTFAVLVVLRTGLFAQPAAISEAEALNPPTPPRLAAIHAAAQRDGWAPQVAMLRSAAVRAYEREKFPAAEAWLNVYRWAAVFGQS